MIIYLLAALQKEKMKINKNVGTGRDKKFCFFFHRKLLCFIAHIYIYFFKIFIGGEKVHKSVWFVFESIKFVWDKNKSKSTCFDSLNTYWRLVHESPVRRKLNVKTNNFLSWYCFSKMKCLPSWSFAQLIVVDIQSPLDAF